MIKNARTSQDILIAEYTLGLLNSREKAEVQQLLSVDSTAAQSALKWEQELLGLVDALPRIHPPAGVLDQILDALDLPHDAGTNDHASGTNDPASAATTPVSAETVEPSDATGTTHASVTPMPYAPEVAHEHDQANSSQAEHPGPTIAQSVATNRAGVALTHNDHPSAKRLSKTVWVGGATVAIFLTGLLTLAFLPRTPVEPPVTIVEVAPTKAAILQAPGQSSTPGWVVTIDPGGNVLLTPKVRTDIPANASVQLWTYNKTIPQPRSLGLIDPNQPVAVPANLMGEIGEDQFFEMTQEPQGGSPTPEPSGPVLFIGRVVTFGE